jgi:uncharacterized membrane protein
VAYYYPQLPETMASHFGPTGQADGWSSKASFMRIYLIIIGSVVTMAIFVLALLPKIPASMINLPHKDYWLAPERRAESMAFIQRQMLWFTAALLLLLVDILQQSVRVNLGRAAQLEHPLTSLIIFGVFTLGWLGVLISKFGRY